MLESKFVEHLKNAWPSIFHFKTHGNQYQRAGIPDLVGSWRGWFVGIEAKIEDNKPTKLQEQTLEHIALTGGLAATATLRGDNVCFVFYLREGKKVNRVSAEPFPLSTVSRDKLKALFTEWLLMRTDSELL